MSVRLEGSGSEIRVDGAWYLHVLARAHRLLQPRSYFEVGVFAGDTLKLAHRKTGCLQARYDELVAEWAPVRFAEFGAERLLELAAVEASQTWLATLKPFGPAQPIRYELRKARARVRRLIAKRKRPEPGSGAVMA